MIELSDRPHAVLYGIDRPPTNISILEPPVAVDHLQISLTNGNSHSSRRSTSSRIAMSSPVHSLALFGATGRMGQSIIQALRESARWRLGAALASPGSAAVGRDAAAAGEPTGVLIGSDAASALRGVTVAVDFSLAAAVSEHARACAAAGVPLLVGTTGLEEATLQALQEAARPSRCWSPRTPRLASACSPSWSRWRPVRWAAATTSRSSRRITGPSAMRPRGRR